MSNVIKVKFQNHFKLYILFQDKIVFESELINKEIDFYEDYDNQPVNGDNIRYFLLDSDKEKIDLLLKEAKIVGSTETIAISDFRQQRKIQYLYLKAIFLVVLIMVLIILWDKYF
ncbi:MULTISPECIES: hypothetical protein [Flavobacterium]|uniref:Uncharacterized protein n=1 Tax=Flavobacterium gawalongense TaxID=2594432 RepID=A0A553BV01_9FLAO|nr:hypothetical protein [Flavobacterium gawalongense]TRX02837.1 hypothetical protein FNW33_05950 [Flavobacterium gawalongense]TRX08145.1 hypothetical protein FNW12_05255 [Flavobacterium gawalongense]TRX11424.1 hypothetical protein FNW10_07735 [Flavobacterium gawalongense]TRX12065.1 hypothetical protein FNW11_03570 [Flavobacterium gawalongense]TRX29058.1 hypothetical protein FNW38_07830 [Flavobacterium gawalongense]